MEFDVKYMSSNFFFFFGGEPLPGVGERCCPMLDLEKIEFIFGMKGENFSFTEDLGLDCLLVHAMG